MESFITFVLRVELDLLLQFHPLFINKIMSSASKREEIASICHNVQDKLRSHCIQTSLKKGRESAIIEAANGGPTCFSGFGSNVSNYIFR